MLQPRGRKISLRPWNDIFRDTNMYVKVLIFVSYLSYIKFMSVFFRSFLSFFYGKVIKDGQKGKLFLFIWKTKSKLIKICFYYTRISLKTI